MTIPFAFPREVRSDEELIDVLGIALFHEDPVPSGLVDRLVAHTIAHQLNAPVATPLDDSLVAVREEQRVSAAFEQGEFQVMVECVPQGHGHTLISFSSTWPRATVRVQAGTSTYDAACDDYGVCSVTVSSASAVCAVFTSADASEKVVLPVVKAP